MAVPAWLAMRIIDREVEQKEKLKESERRLDMMWNSYEKQVEIAQRLEILWDDYLKREAKSNE